jgi:hypothetical protein
VTAPQNLIGDLEDILAGMEIGRHAEAFRRVADLFASGSTRFSEDHLALFDDVMSRLIAEIDSSARAAFGRRFASHFNAPPKTMRLLALTMRSRLQVRFSCGQSNSTKARSLKAPEPRARTISSLSPAVMCLSNVETDGS